MTVEPRESLFEAILGEYHVGLLYAATIHKRFSVSGNQAELGKNDLQQRVTSLHEMLHALQDMMTGYGAFVATHVDELISRVRLITSYLAAKTGTISIPLSEWGRWMSKEDALELRNVLRECTAIRKNLAFIHRRNARNIGTKEILEGTAAFFSEVAERYSLWAYFSDELPLQTHMARRGYDFDDICCAVANGRPPYTTFVADYHRWTAQLPVRMSGRQKSDLLFMLHDIALDVPPAAFMRARLRTGANTLDDFIPAFRYQKAKEIIQAARIPIPASSSPRINPPFTMLTKGPQGWVLHSANEIPWDRLEAANEEFAGQDHRALPAGERRDGDCMNFVNEIYSSLGWPRRSETLTAWLAQLADSSPLSTFQLFRRWRSKCLGNRGEGTPFRNFGTIMNQIIGFPFPLMYLTVAGARFWVSETGEEEIRDMIREFPRQVAYNMFSRSLANQMMDTELLSCPFAGTPWTTEIKCPESPACKAIKLGDSKYDGCLFGHYFQQNFGILPSQGGSGK